MAGAVEDLPWDVLAVLLPAADFSLTPPWMAANNGLPLEGLVGLVVFSGLSGGFTLGAAKAAARGCTGGLAPSPPPALAKAAAKGCTGGRWDEDEGFSAAVVGGEGRGAELLREFPVDVASSTEGGGAMALPPPLAKAMASGCTGRCCGGWWPVGGGAAVFTFRGAATDVTGVTGATDSTTCA